ncbi:hypothetical protein SCWH03_15210 [Streptomyces pacificus]|uniref:Uncharacterized protein n=1 Tax=Streptomyces pacificus TaxID=2705029 RepID=A0A6A0AQS1_9ACTN|nr:hypothetical protein SCWH03_15210 [Streptomyces pacificus]
MITPTGLHGHPFDKVHTTSFGGDARSSTAGREYSDGRRLDVPPVRRLKFQVRDVQAGIAGQWGWRRAAADRHAGVRDALTQMKDRG